MDAKLNRWVTLGLTGVVLGLLALASPAAAGEGQGKGLGRGLAKGQGQGEGLGNREELKAKLLDGTWAKHIQARIDRIKERLANHPNAPADIKAAAEKLIADLTVQLDLVNKLAAAVQAKDKETAKGLLAQIRTNREKILADRIALLELILKHRQERQGAAGAKK